MVRLRLAVELDYGPRNQRRTPSVLNTALYPSLMWNGRFAAGSGDPFDNSMGFAFPLPEGTTRFPAGDQLVTHLLIAQAHIPPTELVEAAGFTGTLGTSARASINSTMVWAGWCRCRTGAAFATSRSGKGSWSP